MCKQSYMMFCDMTEHQVIEELNKCEVYVNVDSWKYCDALEFKVTYVPVTSDIYNKDFIRKGIFIDGSKLQHTEMAEIMRQLVHYEGDQSMKDIFGSSYVGISSFALYCTWVLYCHFYQRPNPYRHTSTRQSVVYFNKDLSGEFLKHKNKVQCLYTEYKNTNGYKGYILNFRAYEEFYEWIKDLEQLDSVQLAEQLGIDNWEKFWTVIQRLKLNNAVY